MLAQLLVTLVALVPGEYLAEGGWGTLTLNPGQKGAVVFSIEALGANAHSCSLEGEARDGRASLEAIDPKDPCIVRFTPFEGGIDVQPGASGACRFYCGMRASFEGKYFTPPPLCRPQVVTATRNAFKKDYDAKRFAEARRKLEPVLKECLRFLHWVDAGRIRNDLAVTLHKLADFAGCRALLEPLAKDAAMTQAQLQEAYPPSDAEAWVPIARATRTNLRLCSR